MSKLTILIAALIALALPSAASATTFCVSEQSCSGTDEGTDLQQALTDAKTNPGPDRVEIGPDSFSAGPYTYDDGAAGNGVEIVGAGADATSLTGSQQSGVLVVSGGASSVSSLGIDIGVVGGKGLVFNGPSHADHLKITSIKASTQGVELVGGSFSDSTVSLPVPAGAVNNAVTSLGGQGTTATLEDNTLTAQRVISTVGKGAVVVRRLHAKSEQALFPTCGQLTVEDAAIDTAATKAAAGLTASAAVSCPVTVTVRHSTFVGHGGTLSSGVFVLSQSAAPATVALHDSIVTGFHNDIRRLGAGGVANLSTFFSAYDPATTSDSNTNGGSGALTENGAIAADPRLVDPAGGNLRLADDSPLIDAGDPAGLDPAESTTDADGLTREIDGRGAGIARSDVGAFEHDALPAPPPPSPAQPSGSGEPPVPVTTTTEAPAPQSDAPSAPAESTPPAAEVPPAVVSGDPPAKGKPCTKPKARTRHRHRKAKRAATCRKAPKTHKRHHRRHR